MNIICNVHESDGVVSCQVRGFDGQIVPAIFFYDSIDSVDLLKWAVFQMKMDTIQCPLEIQNTTNFLVDSSK